MRQPRQPVRCMTLGHHQVNPGGAGEQSGFGSVHAPACFLQSSAQRRVNCSPSFGPHAYGISTCTHPRSDSFNVASMHPGTEVNRAAVGAGVNLGGQKVKGEVFLHGPGRLVDRRAATGRHAAGRRAAHIGWPFRSAGRGPCQACSEIRYQPTHRRARRHQCHPFAQGGLQHLADCTTVSVWCECRPTQRCGR